MKSAVIIAVLLAAVLTSGSVMPASAAANNGGSMSAHDKETCRLLERNFKIAVGATEGRTGLTNLARINFLVDALDDLNRARSMGCPWAKNATIPW